MPNHLHVTRLVVPVEIGRQKQRHEQQRFAYPLYIHRIVLEPSGNVQNTGLGDDVPFVLRPQEYFDFRIEVGRQIRQLGAQEKEIFVDIVVVRLQLHFERFDIIAEAHVDSGAREVTVAAETDRRREYRVRQRFLFHPGAEQMVVFVAGNSFRPGWKV